MSDEKKQELENEIQAHTQFSKKAVADNSINTSIRKYCMGYGFGTINYGYIAVPKLSTAKVSTLDLDDGTAGIVSYDRTEKADAYIGQINMLTASSFCGLNGLLWGYHLCNNTQDEHVMFTYPGDQYPPGDKLPGQQKVNVCAIAPLLDAGERLFGRMDTDEKNNPINRLRFPPLPGCMCVCANKNASLYGPGYVWSIVGVAIAKHRTKDSNLFIEDANAIKAVGTDDTQIQLSEISVRKELKKRLVNIAKSMVLCGQDQNVVYDKIYIGAKYIKVNEGEYGTALCCAPYVQLPTDALPKAAKGSVLVDMSLAEWENKLKLTALPPLDRKDKMNDFQGVGIGDTKKDVLLFAIHDEKK